MSEQSGGMGAAVGDKVEQAKDVVSAQTTEAAQRGRGLVQHQIDQRSTQLGEQTRSASQTLRRVAEQSRTEGNAQHARMADMAADQGERVSAFLVDADGERMLNEAEDFARRQPWALAGAGLALGFVLARALKASSSSRYQRRSAEFEPSYSTAYSSGLGSQRAYPDAEPARPRVDDGEATTRIDVGAVR